MRSTETLIVATLILGFTLGCAWSITRDGLKVAIGNTEIRSDCDQNNVCKDVVSGGEISVPFAAVASDVVKAGVRLADAVPGVELGNPDELTVRIKQDE